MTPQQVQRMMDFILQSQANFFVRMERWEEESKKEFEKFKEQIAEIKKTNAETAAYNRETAKIVRQNAAEIRARVKEERAYQKKVRALEAADRRTTKRVKSIKDLLKLFSNRQDLHSRRITRLEDKGR